MYSITGSKSSTTATKQDPPFKTRSAWNRARRAERLGNLAKAYFRDDFMPDSTIRKLNEDLIYVVMSYEPESIFEFGCGTCKNLLLEENKAAQAGMEEQFKTYGMDVNPAALNIGKQQKSCKAELYCGDEDVLHEMIQKGQMPQVDVSFTCGCLDHIPALKTILDDLKQISRKAVLCYETNSIVGRYYYGHRYSFFDFKRLRQYDYLSSKSQGGDGALYNLWCYRKDGSPLE